MIVVAVNVSNGVVHASSVHVMHLVSATGFVVGEFFNVDRPSEY